MKTREDFIKFAEANRERATYKRKMGALFPNGWTVMDLADWLCRSKLGRGLAELDGPLPEPPVVLQPAEPLADPVEQRMTEYRAIYATDTPNDEMMLRILCQNEIAIQQMSDKLQALIESGRITSKEVESIVAMTTALTRESRLIQKDLGIDKPSRGEGQDAGVKLLDYINQARTVLHRQSVPIACPACFRTEAKIKNLYGYFVWHIAEVTAWELKFTCPRCHAEMRIGPDLTREMKEIFGWV